MSFAYKGLRYRRTLDQCNSNTWFQACNPVWWYIVVVKFDSRYAGDTGKCFTCSHTLEPPTTDTIGSIISVLITKVSSFQGENYEVGTQSSVLIN